jgi:isoquinoline 1-oxidoreductase alpha subunit
MPRDLTVNGTRLSVDVDDDTPLLWVLRDVLGLTGTKFGCGIALCGACTVHVNGESRRSCVMPLSAIPQDAQVRTVETLAELPEGQVLQQAWLDLEVVQCGYCQSGQLMSAAALLSANRAPTDADIDLVMSGNICRCGTYGRIRAAIKQAANRLPPTGRAAGSSSAEEHG